MSPSKKARTKHQKSKRNPGKKANPTQRAGTKKKLAMKSKPVARKSVKLKKAQKKASKKKLGTTRVRAVSTLALIESQTLDTSMPSSARIGGGAAGQSGDLQGLSGVERADSESVEELLEEGNAFEAGVVMGVQEADDADPEEVHTHQVPEDDVPGEYLDND